MGRPLALLVAASLGVAVGCLVDLSPARDCGDGYVDALAGEDCEPTRADSLEGRCPAGEVPGPGACDPDTCTFVADACTRCGNGLLDPGEACDPKDMSVITCPFGGEARCRSDCTVDPSGCARGCGDGVVDPDEECDPGPDGHLGDKGVPVEVDCTTLPAPSARGYGSGVSTRCVECKWDRSGCSYCGNDRLETLAVIKDEDLLLDSNLAIQPIPEVCDHDVNGQLLADPQALSQHCQSRCGAGGATVACAFACADTCDAFAAPDPDDVVAEDGCCLVAGEPCPYTVEGDLPDGALDCCYVRELEGAPKPGKLACSGGITGDPPKPRVCR